MGNARKHAKTNRIRSREPHKDIGINSSYIIKTSPLEASESQDKTSATPAKRPSQGDVLSSSANSDVSWNSKVKIPEGELPPQDRSRLKQQQKRVRAITRAFSRSESMLGRSDEELRKALGALYGLGLELQGQPELIHELLAERRVKVTAATKRNVFLAATKLCLGKANASTQTRYANALAYCASQGQSFEEVPTALEKTGIREAADAWTEMRRLEKGGSQRKPSPKPEPIAKLRASSRTIKLPPETPMPAADYEGPFLLIAEQTPSGLLALAAVADLGLVKRAVRIAVGKFATKESASAPNANDES